MVVKTNVKTINQVPAYNDLVGHYSGTGMMCSRRLSTLVSSLLSQRFGVLPDKISQLKVSSKSTAVNLLFAAKLLSKLGMNDEAVYTAKLGVNRLVRATHGEKELNDITLGASGFSVKELGLNYNEVLEANMNKVLPSVASDGAKYSCYGDFLGEMNSYRELIGETPIKSVYGAGEFGEKLLSDSNKIETIGGTKGGHLSALNPGLGFRAKLPESAGIFC